MRRSTIAQMQRLFRTSSAQNAPAKALQRAAVSAQHVAPKSPVSLVPSPLASGNPRDDPRILLPQGVSRSAAASPGVPNKSRGVATAAAGEELRSIGRRFVEDGYVVFPGILRDELPALLKIAEELVTRADKKLEEGGSHDQWNSIGFVMSGGEDGKSRPRLFKVQGAGFEEPETLQLFKNPKVTEKVQEIYGEILGGANKIPSEVDVFGTKFFPMFPGNTSVNWHTDSHYFGTYSPKVLSCAVYLQDTDKGNGCLRLLPKSHKAEKEWEHAPGEGDWKMGEWVSGVEEKEQENLLDICVEAGTVVLFDARILHAARKNESISRTRYSFFGHFVPGDLNFAWRGSDFSRGVYEDRHRVL